jgi:hypothetical protein
MKAFTAMDPPNQNQRVLDTAMGSTATSVGHGGLRTMHAASLMWHTQQAHLLDVLWIAALGVHRSRMYLAWIPYKKSSVPGCANGGFTILHKLMGTLHWICWVRHPDSTRMSLAMVPKATVALQRYHLRRRSLTNTSHHHITPPHHDLQSYILKVRFSLTTPMIPGCNLVV